MCLSVYAIYASTHFSADFEVIVHIYCKVINLGQDQIFNVQPSPCPPPGLTEISIKLKVGTVKHEQDFYWMS